MCARFLSVSCVLCLCLIEVSRSLCACVMGVVACVVQIVFACQLVCSIVSWFCGDVNTGVRVCLCESEHICLCFAILCVYMP